MTNFSGKNLDNAESVGRKTEHQDDASQRVGLPEGWIETSLDSISSDVSYGYTAKSTTEKVGPHLLRITDIQDNQVDWKAVPFCEIEKGKTDQYLLKADDLVFARTGATVGKSFLIKGNIPESVFASYLIRVRSVKQIGIKYLAHFFNSASYWNQITEFSSGIGQPNVNGTKLKELNLPLAPLAEQKQIAQKLDELLAQVDTLKTRLDAIPNILKRFRQSVLAAAVSGRLTEEWRRPRKIKLTVEEYECAISVDKFKVKFTSDNPVVETENDWLKLALGQLLTVSSGDGLTSKEMQKGNIPVYGGNGINGYHNKANFTEQKVVIGRVGFYCGSVHFTQERSWVTDNALVVNFPKSLVDIKFIYNLLRATNLREDSASTAQPVISGSKIYPIELMLPPLEEQTEIVRRVEQLFTYADQIEQRVKDAQARVNHLTQSILAKAFRGELTADWRAQNPELISGENSAAALLERIKAEREVVGKAKKKKA
ncbi:restriction endonuclease subunit S [Cellvibrio sp.]|uniref:restriction endonuclease subunit S n=1 Tax=Cellvibrio sp. TaxID=1965322 RepID=UPI003964791F